ncbi:MAG TPA: lysylphosphatidylglycerol synthase transmembrane domain-containing protein [Candidatus Angelobacter sp.]|nr:lysylphosphatidylglycerol synthase transmembrane domain-containing protein [Candidatus Angelobacter sp.]
MNKKRLIITVLVLGVLGFLVYLQVRTWKRFDWHHFWMATGNTNKFDLLAGVALVWVDYYLRALRWKIMLRPVCEARTADLVAPTVIGFTGLALLGRPGEFIRPYLIGRKVNLSISSQLAVWAVERIFDAGAFTLVMAINILGFRHQLRRLPGFANAPTRHFLGIDFTAFGLFEVFSIAVLLWVAFAGLVAFRVRSNPERAAKFFGRIFGLFSPRVGATVAKRVHAFGEGLNTIKDFTSFLQIAGLSLLIWVFIGLAYLAVVHAYSIHRLANLKLYHVLLLTAASVAGGTLQLPVVGGGSQLATIGMLKGVLLPDRPGMTEIAISCGIMLWLVTFMSVVPLGLAIARSEHVSLMRIEKESLEESRHRDEPPGEPPELPTAND